MLKPHMLFVSLNVNKFSVLFVCQMQSYIISFDCFVFSPDLLAFTIIRKGFKF